MTLRLLAAFALVATAIAQAQYQPPHERPGPAAETLFFRSFYVDRAPLDLRAGNMDLYLYGLRTDAALELQGARGFTLFEVPATTLSLLLNPAPAPAGRLNPFALAEVRRAMQYLINRDFIARDIFRGMARAMNTHVSPWDYDYLTVYELDRGAGIRYEPELARELIAEAMEAAGAERVDGVWHYGGQPVRLRFIARVEDERREIGDLVRAELERAGFQVTMSYQSFAPAVLTVYSTDPQAFEWHLYTEGWGRSAPQRYDVGTVNAMNAPWLGNMPGWREVGFWQYEHEELDALGQQLFRGEFRSQAERDAIYRRMTELGLEASVRLWLVTVVNSFPAQDRVVGVTRDVVAGPRSPWALREAFVPGQDELTVGHLWVWTERTTWNPIGGFGDVYSVDIWRNLHDPPIWNHPFAGVPQPFRAGFEVETAGPEGNLAVPADAVLWDAETKRWQPVGADAQAVSKVTFDYRHYVGSRWHHGQPITLADGLYAIAQSFDLSYDPAKSRIEVALAVTARPYLETFRGFRVVSDTELEVYVDFWHFDPAYIAAYASPTSFGMPWEVLAAMDHLVFEERRAAYSDTAAARFNVPWLSLVMRQDARLIERTLRQFAARGYLPEGVFELGGVPLVDAEEVAARYQAALDWFREYGHLIISNGPFYLARYDPPAQFAELRAFRDERYPYRPGDRYLGEPPALAIERVNFPQVTLGTAVEVEVSVEGPGELGLRYLFVDPVSAEVLASGEAEAGAERGAFRVHLPAALTETLFPGLYQLSLVSYSSESALVAERRVDIEVMP